MVKVHFTLSCRLQWAHTYAVILVAYIDYKYIESVLCVHVVDEHDVFI
jgi:hypothetical protein